MCSYHIISALYLRLLPVLVLQKGRTFGWTFLKHYGQSTDYDVEVLPSRNDNNKNFVKILPECYLALSLPSPDSIHSPHFTQYLRFFEWKIVLRTSSQHQLLS